jgi:hypothetical protein
MKMTIYRADPSEIDTIDVELSKKSGKNLGLGFYTSNPRGLLVTDIVMRFINPHKSSIMNNSNVSFVLDSGRPC